MPGEYVLKLDDGRFIPLYEALMQFEYKTGVSDAEDIGKKLIERMHKEGFIQKSYSRCNWSSNYDGWWVFEVHDQQKWRDALNDLRMKEALDRYLKLHNTIGEGYPTPAFSIEVSRAGGGGFGDSQNWTVSVAVTCNAQDNTTEFQFEVVDGTGSFNPPRATAHNGQAQSSLTTEGPVKIFISVPPNHGKRGYLAPVPLP